MDRKRHFLIERIHQMIVDSSDNKILLQIYVLLKEMKSYQINKQQ